MKLAKSDLYPEWCRIDRLEQSGELSAEEARFLKEGIFGHAPARAGAG